MLPIFLVEISRVKTHARLSLGTRSKHMQGWAQGLLHGKTCSEKERERKENKQTLVSKYKIHNEKKDVKRKTDNVTYLLGRDITG